MAKKKTSAPMLDSYDALDNYMDAVMDEARKHYGSDKVYTGEEAEHRIVVLPLPALSLRYLFQSNGMALGRMTMVFGQEGSCKSSLLYEAFRWHRRAGRGKAYLMESESKDSPALRNALLEYDAKACDILSCGSLEDWQEGITKYLDFIQELLDKGRDGAPGVGRSLAICIGVDSLVGKSTRESQANIGKQGFATREHPIEALIISRFMKAMPQRIAEWPISIWGTNHLKPSTDFMGRPVDNVGGGMSLKFQETYGIKMQRMGDIELADSGGISTILTMQKNSLGQSRKKIQADMKWYWREDQTGQLRQLVYWDWYSASIAKLLEFPARGVIGNKIQEIVDLHGETGKRAWSRTLNMPKDDPQDYETVGRALEDFLVAQPAAASALYPLLGIREYKQFQPGIDIRQQLSAPAESTDANPNE